MATAQDGCRPPRWPPSPAGGLDLVHDGWLQRQRKRKLPALLRPEPEVHGILLVSQVMKPVQPGARERIYLCRMGQRAHTGSEQPRMATLEIVLPTHKDGLVISACLYDSSLQ